MNDEQETIRTMTWQDRADLLNYLNETTGHPERWTAQTLEQRYNPPTPQGKIKLFIKRLKDILKR